MNKGMPDSGYLMIEFDHCDMLSKTLKRNSKACNSTACEGFDKFNRLAWTADEPCSHPRHEPCLASRVAKRASQRHSCHIDN